MKLLGLLIVLALGLFLTYYIAGDYFGFTSGGGSESIKFAPMKLGAEAVEKLKQGNDEMQRKIEESSK